MTDKTPLFPIRELARRTGVKTSTLRAWEIRHGLLRPTRTDSGHRLYGEDDILRVRRLRELTGRGLGLDEIAPLLDAPRAASQLPAPTLAPAWQSYLETAISAIEDFGSDRLDQVYNEACALYPIDLVTTNLLVPVLEALGQRWDQRPAGIAEEHFFSAWLRNKLGARLHHGQGQRRGRPLVLACLPGEHHELGLLMFALGLLERGHPVIYLGADMPVRQITPLVRHCQARAVVLAGRAQRKGAVPLDEIAGLMADTGLPIFVGSHVSVRLRPELLRAGAQPLGDDIAVGLDRLEARLAARPSP